MARRCQLSGKQSGFGAQVSHSHRVTKRKFQINLVERRVFLEDENRWVRLRISARMLRTLNKKGPKAIISKYKMDPSVLKAAKALSAKPAPQAKGSAA
ncbi:MAG: 50S ribosomal protein L28 [Leptospirales bacterium]|nr:50S ribosomal protein L28 [Leptospirales bacterium]